MFRLALIFFTTQYPSVLHTPDAVNFAFLEAILLVSVASISFAWTLPSLRSQISTPVDFLKYLNNSHRQYIS